MAPLCFATSATALGKSLFGAPVAQSTSPRPRRAAPAQTVRAELPLVPGVPPGEDVRDNAPLRYYVPRPVETYEDRGFATILPRTWEGETETVGASDIPPLTKESIEESRQVPVDAAATGAFVAFSQMVKAEREAQLAELKARNAAPTSGRATCGEEEGKTYVSNYRTVLVDGVKCVEYWGRPNGAVPRLFGGPGA